MEEKKLFVTKTDDAIELFPYFEQVVYPERCEVFLSPPTFDREKNYVLSLPLPLVSPRIYQKGSRFSLALGMEERLFADLCRTNAAIVRKNDGAWLSADEETKQRSVPFRDCVILRSLTAEGRRGVEAFRFLCEEYLPGLPLDGDATVTAVRVSPFVAEKLFRGEKGFMEDPVYAAYVKVFVRVQRIVKLYLLSAPRLVLLNEKRMLQMAIETLLSLAPYPL